MKSNFKEPICEVIRFDQVDIVTASYCACVIAGEDWGEGADSTCTGANVACTCNPNYDDPSANCET